MSRLPFGMSERAVAGAGVFALALFVFVLIAIRPELAKDDLFKMLAQAIVAQGFVQLTVSFFFRPDAPKAPPCPPEDPNA